MAVASAIILAMLSLTSALAPWIAPYSYEEQNLDLRAVPPQAHHWLGTDALGRDQLTRLLYGGRVSLMVGIVATGVALVIGVTYGAISGYLGGKLDALMMQLPASRVQKASRPSGEIARVPTNMATRKNPQVPRAENSVVPSELLPSGRNA